MYLKRLTADDNNIDVNALATVRGILLTPGSDAATAAIYDALTVTGNPIFKIKAPAGQSVFIPFTDGFDFKTGISVDVTGTDPELYLYLE